MERTASAPSASAPSASAPSASAPSASARSASASTTPTAQEQLVLAEVLQAIRAVRYGSVQIILQDAHVVQIDTLEKKRLDR